MNSAGLRTRGVAGYIAFRHQYTRTEFSKEDHKSMVTWSISARSVQVSRTQNLQDISARPQPAMVASTAAHQHPFDTHPHTNATKGLPKTFFPSTLNLTPSPFKSFLFSSSVIPRPSFGQLPLNPPSDPPAATTLWHGTAGASGFRRMAFPTARGDDERCAARAP